MANSTVTLIGMPASGKSTIGRKAARRLGVPFIDGDDVIQQTHGKSLAQLIAAHGNDGFLDLEADALCTIQGPGVVAPGGSVIYRDRAMEHLVTLGPVVFLDVSTHELRRRIGDLQARGVVLAPGMTFDDLVNQRVPLYRRWATTTLAAERMSIEAAAEAVERLVRSADVG